jgi:predicted outer membrane protein
MRKISFLNPMCVAASLLFATANTGCDNDNDNDNDNGGTNNNDGGTTQADVQAALDTGNTRGQTLATQAGTQIKGGTDPVMTGQIASILHTINDGEIMQANLALASSSDSDVQDFAHMIVTDHQQANATLDAMLQSSQVSMKDNPISVMLRTEAAASTTQLQQTPATDFPRAYLLMQVQMHQEAYVLVGSLNGVSSNGGFNQILSDAYNMIAKHRDDAAARLGNR